MKIINQTLSVAMNMVVIILLAVAIGCARTEDGTVGETPSSATADVHNHPTEGPHHGGLIELGNEEFHAELVHDEGAGSVTIYILDSAATSTVPIDATELLVNLSHDGQAEQFTLSASPDSGDPPGKSSRFSSSDAALAEELDHEHSEAQLVVTINGKQYRGAIAHGQSEHGDDHDDGDHDH